MNTSPKLSSSETATIVSALQFTVEKTLRKMKDKPDNGKSLNERIVVVELLSRIGRVNDVTTLTAAILHHVFDSSASVKMELDVYFGPEIRMLVQELAGNKHLSHTEQMQELLDRIPSFSSRAKEIVLAEKISKLQEIAAGHPEYSSSEQINGYLTWMGKMIQHCRGINPDLEDCFDELYEDQSREFRAAK